MLGGFWLADFDPDVANRDVLVTAPDCDAIAPEGTF
jgi:hypothetical protein